MSGKQRIGITAALCGICLIVFSFVFDIWHPTAKETVLRVGFIYENDESTPYTYNFYLAQSAIEKEYGSRIQVYSRSNVLNDETEDPIRELIQRGCTLLFTNSYSEQVMELAAEFPQVEFCQVSFRQTDPKSTPENYHTFKGAAYQARYVSGVAAGLKLKEEIDAGTLTPEAALVGYVAAMPTDEVISGYTAFLLGIRSVVPEAVMRVRYTGVWSSYTLEKAQAARLIAEGCVVIGQHTDTIGPAVACEESADRQKLVHIGYNQSMLDVAPTTSLISARINWTPYIAGAVGAMLSGKKIEQSVPGTVWGRDMCAGFDRGWVEMLELNESIAAEGTDARLQKEIDALIHGRTEVFRGPYTGVNPADSSDTIDLSAGFRENAQSSSPTFHYLLKDIITVEE